MVYKKYKISRLEDFNTFNIMSDLLSGYSSMVIMQTEQLELDKTNYRFLTREQIKNIENLELLNDKVNYVISHSIVNIYFCELMECKTDDLEYYYNHNSKPYIKNRSGINFNISHTLGCVAVAFSNVNIGIDVENIERKIDFQSISKHYFSDYENNYINNEMIKFFELWVAKEAYLKCIGCGLLKELKHTHISIVNTNSFEIINHDSYRKNLLQIEYIQSRYVIAITTSEVNNESCKTKRA